MQSPKLYLISYVLLFQFIQSDAFTLYRDISSYRFRIQISNLIINSFNSFNFRCTIRGCRHNFFCHADFCFSFPRFFELVSSMGCCWFCCCCCFLWLLCCIELFRRVFVSLVFVLLSIKTFHISSVHWNIHEFFDLKFSRVCYRYTICFLPHRYIHTDTHIFID